MNAIAIGMALVCIGAWMLMAAEVRRAARKRPAKRVTMAHVPLRSSKRAGGENHPMFPPPETIAYCR